MSQLMQQMEGLMTPPGHTPAAATGAGEDSGRRSPIDESSVRGYMSVEVVKRCAGGDCFLRVVVV